MKSVIILVVVAALCAYMASAELSPFVGGQQWSETGLYAETGLESDKGFFCLCTCNTTEHGTFCDGGGYANGAVRARFLAAFWEAEEANAMAKGSLVATDTASDFLDQVVVTNDPQPGAFNYVGTRTGPGAFVWRGSMEGVDCGTLNVCRENVCTSGEPQFEQWAAACERDALNLS